MIAAPSIDLCALATPAVPAATTMVARADFAQVMAKVDVPVSSATGKPEPGQPVALVDDAPDLERDADTIAIEAGDALADVPVHAPPVPLDVRPILQIAPLIVIDDEPVPVKPKDAAGPVAATGPAARSLPAMQVLLAGERTVAVSVDPQDRGSAVQRQGEAEPMPLIAAIGPVAGPMPDLPMPLPTIRQAQELVRPLMPERPPVIADFLPETVRDVLKVSTGKELRFSVRPENLGLVSVSIQPGEAGPTLRLGVETSAAVQAVRQAEPMMNDARGSAPFAQVTVDLDAPGSRDRPARPAVVPKRLRSDIPNMILRPATLVAGRYA